MFLPWNRIMLRTLDARQRNSPFIILTRSRIIAISTNADCQVPWQEPICNPRTHKRLLTCPTLEIRSAPIRASQTEPRGWCYPSGKSLGMPDLAQEKSAHKIAVSSFPRLLPGKSRCANLRSASISPRRSSTAPDGLLHRIDLRFCS